MYAAVLAAGLKVELAMTVEGNRDTKEFAVEDPGEKNVEAPNPGFATPEAFRSLLERVVRLRTKETYEAVITRELERQPGGEGLVVLGFCLACAQRQKALIVLYKTPERWRCRTCGSKGHVGDLVQKIYGDRTVELAGRLATLLPPVQKEANDFEVSRGD
jgi:hypothetical protein